MVHAVVVDVVVVHNGRVSLGVVTMIKSDVGTGLSILDVTIGVVEVGKTVLVGVAAIWVLDGFTLKFVDESEGSSFAQ